MTFRKTIECRFTLKLVLDIIITYKTRLTGYVNDFSVDYDAIAVDDILDIHRYYLMKKNDII